MRSLRSISAGPASVLDILCKIGLLPIRWTIHNAFAAKQHRWNAWDKSGFVVFSSKSRDLFDRRLYNKHIYKQAVICNEYVFCNISV